MFRKTLSEVFEQSEIKKYIEERMALVTELQTLVKESKLRYVAKHKQGTWLVAVYARGGLCVWASSDGNEITLLRRVRDYLLHGVRR